MPDPFALPVAFHFSVSFTGGDPAIADAAFQEVGGLETEIEVTTLQEGGENRFLHRLPEKMRHPNLTLKRALGPADSGLVTWCKDTLEGGLQKPLKPKGVVVKLLDEKANPVAVWSLGGAFPLKWSLTGLDAMKNELAFETIELSYLTLNRES